MVNQPRRHRRPRLRQAAGEPARCYINETGFYSQRPFVHLILGGVFERFPKLKFVLTEMGCAWIPPMLEQLDQVIDEHPLDRAIGELRYTDEHMPAEDRPPSTSSRTSGSARASPARPTPPRRTALGIDRFMWGSDYPHDEGTYPFTTRAPAPGVLRRPARASSSRSSPATRPSSTTSTSTRSRPLADQFGPTVDEIAEPLDRAARQRQPGAAPRDELEAKRRACAASVRSPGRARMSFEPRRVRSFHAAVMPHAYVPKPWGMSGATKSSTSFPAAAHRAASMSVSSSRWSAVPTLINAGGRFDRSANAGEISGARRCVVGHARQIALAEELDAARVEDVLDHRSPPPRWLGGRPQSCTPYTRLAPSTRSIAPNSSRMRSSTAAAMYPPADSPPVRIRPAAELVVAVFEQPRRDRDAVVGTGRVRVFGRHAVVDRHDGHSRAPAQLRVGGVVHLRRAEDHAAAVEMQVDGAAAIARA